MTLTRSSTFLRWFSSLQYLILLLVNVCVQAMDMFTMEDGCASLLEGVGRVQCPVLVLGVTSDVLFPIEQQREMTALLKESGKMAICWWL